MREFFFFLGIHQFSCYVLCKYNFMINQICILSMSIVHLTCSLSPFLSLCFNINIENIYYRGFGTSSQNLMTNTKVQTKDNLSYSLMLKKIQKKIKNQQMKIQIMLIQRFWKTIPKKRRLAFLQCQMDLTVKQVDDSLILMQCVVRHRLITTSLRMSQSRGI